MKSIQRFLQEAKSSVKIVIGDLKNKEDFEAAVKLLLENWKHSGKLSKYKPPDPASNSKAINNLKGEMKYNPFLVFIKDNDVPVGFILSVNWKQGPGGVGSLSHMFMYDKYRGKGLGLNLVNMSIDNLKKQGCKIIRVGVTAGNEKVISLYKRAGFDIESYSMRQDV